VFKIVKGFVNIDRKIFSRRHLVIVGMLRLDVHKFSFSQRVVIVNHWNASTQHAVDCNTVNPLLHNVTVR